MTIWLVTSGEPIPSEKERPHRTGILAQKLSEEGHEVVWWTTTFDHQKKEYLYDKTYEEQVNPKLSRVYLHSKTPYKKNVSLSRIKNHYEVAVSFKKESRKRRLPDLIFCSFPTIDLAYESVRYGKGNGIPVVVDVRDLWPDIFLFPFSGVIKSVVKVFIKPFVNRTRYIFQNCYSITGVSDGYLNFGLNYGCRSRSINDRVFPLGYDDKGISSVNVENIDFTYLNIDFNRINVWFVGTFGQSYDLLTVIDAAREIEKTDPQILFILTGDGEQMENWKNASLGLNNIVFTGWVGKAELKYISLNAHIGLMAYAKNAPQGLPNKIYEYMALGLPVLSSLQGEAKDLIESNGIGLTYEPQNPQDFLKKLKEITKNKKSLVDLKKKCRKVFEQKFNSSIIYNDLVSFLQTIATK